MSLLITRLGPGDGDRALKNCSLFRNMRGETANLSDFLADRSCILVTAEADGRQAGQVLGYILRRWDPQPPKLFLYSIDVLEEFRRRGIARQMIREFNKIGSESGCGEAFVLTCESNEPAMRLYESTGGSRTFPDDVMFQWDLSPTPDSS